MMNLLKYEVRKNLFGHIILALVLVLGEGLFLFMTYTDKQIAAFVFFIVLAILVLLTDVILGIQSIACMHRDMNTKQGYMLFMTPNSNARILGAKLIECIAGITLTTACGFLVCWANWELLCRRFEDINRLKEMASVFIDAIQQEMGGISVRLIAVNCVDLMTNFICMVTLGFFADVLVSSVLNGKKHAMLLTVVLYILGDILLTKLAGVVVKPITDRIVAPLIRSVYSCVVSAVMYVCTAKLMDKCLSV